jgi:hypothetical protein
VPESRSGRSKRGIALSDSSAAGSHDADSDGQLCIVVPVDTSTLNVGDIVLCKVSGNEYLHIVNPINAEQFQIGDNQGVL